MKKLINLHLLGAALLGASLVNANNTTPGFSDTLTQYKSWLAHKGGATTLVYSPSGKWMASAGLDHSIRIWDCQNNKLIRILAGHEDEIFSLALSPDGKYLLSSGYDKRVIVWSTNDWKKLKKWENSSWSSAMAFNHKGQAAIGWQDGKVRVIDIPSGSTLLSFDTEFAVYSICWSADDKTIITGGPVSAWDAVTGKKIKEFRVPGSVHGIAVAAGSTHFVSVHGRGTAFVTDLVSADTVFTYTEKRRTRVPAATGFESYMVNLPILACAFSEDGKWLALSCYGNHILLIDHESHAVSKVLAGFRFPVTAIAFSPAGKELAGCSSDGSILTWQLKN